MRQVAMGCAVAMAFTVSGCSVTGRAPDGGLPLGVGNGAGSQYGNYAASVEGEMRGDAGETCVVFNWDRPLTAELAVRFRSASCPSREFPGRMVSRDLSRTLIPLSESNLRDASEAPRQ